MKSTYYYSYLHEEYIDEENIVRGEENIVRDEENIVRDEEYVVRNEEMKSTEDNQSSQYHMTSSG